MEKYARQHLAEGVQHANELHVDFDSEIFRTLNSHYNRNNQIEVMNPFFNFFLFDIFPSKLINISSFRFLKVFAM
jgi:hypothetical protein